MDPIPVLRLRFPAACSIVLLALGLIVDGCTPRSERPAATPAVGQADLSDATFRGIEEAGGAVTLSGGRWDGPPFEAGAATAPSVTLLEGLEPRGDLDHDGREEAVALLSGSAGGTGSMLYAAVMEERDGHWVNVATAPVGDRVDVRDAVVEEGKLRLDVVQAGEQDAMCCPGELATRRWLLEGDSLVEEAAEVTGRLTPASIGGREWVLRRWSEDEEADPEPRVTLQAVEGRWAGSAGCNRYTVGVQPGELPGMVKLGAAVTTRRACPEPASSTEDRFLRLLARVRQFEFVAGRLTLTSESEGELVTLTFEHE
jgi:heat shock protein HslJ